MQNNCFLPLRISDHIREVEEDEESIPAPPFSPISEVGAGEMFGNSISESEASDSELDGDESPSKLSPNEVQTENPSSGTAAQSSPEKVSTQESAPDLFESWRGYKIVGDNIDKNVRASYQRLDCTTRSFHHFHAYAVLDRVDFSGLSDVIPPQAAVDPLICLPSKDDIALLKRDISTLISR